MKVGKNLLDLRKKMGLSQQDFAKKVGVSQAAITYWENGKRQPRLEQLRKIAEALNITLNILLDGCWDEYKNEVSNDFETSMVDYEMLNQLVFKYDKLNNLGKKEAIKRVDELTEIKKYTDTENELYE